MSYLTTMWKHFKTVCRHKIYVFQECRACGITWQGITHDLSKFSWVEFGPAARYFQGNRSPIEAEKEDLGYSFAWLHHKGINPHHWEFWTDFAEEDGSIITNKIPFNYVVEMVCDWVGAGKAYQKERWTTDSPMNYFIKMRKGRHFHPDTEDLIVLFLDGIKFKGLAEFHKMAKCESPYSYLRVDYEGKYYIP